MQREEPKSQCIHDKVEGDPEGLGESASSGFAISPAQGHTPDNWTRSAQVRGNRTTAGTGLPAAPNRRAVRLCLEWEPPLSAVTSAPGLALVLRSQEMGYPAG